MYSFNQHSVWCNLIHTKLSTPTDRITFWYFSIREQPLAENYGCYVWEHDNNPPKKKGLH